MSWLHAPLYLVRALASQLPAIRASESQLRAQEVAVGSGSIKPSDQRAIQRDWQQLASGDAPTRRVKTRKQLDEMANELGIAVVKTPR